MNAKPLFEPFESSWRINTEALDATSLLVLAELIAARVGPFGMVEGLPRSGDALAEALRPMIAPGDPTLLIVDDALTTGAAMTHVRGGHRPTVGYVIFDRSAVVGMQRPDWIGALWTLAPPTRKEPVR